MLLNNISDKIVFSLLKNIHNGSLEVIKFNGEKLIFGDLNNELKAQIIIKSPALTYNLIKGGCIGFAECYIS